MNLISTTDLVRFHFPFSSRLGVSDLLGRWFSPDGRLGFVLSVRDEEALVHITVGDQHYKAWLPVSWMQST
jgi:hypothetical protein